MKSTQYAALRNGGAMALTAALAVALVACSGTGQAPASAQGSTASTSVQTAPVVHSAAFTAFHGVVPSAPSNKQCSLDEINGQPASNAGAVASGSDVIFGGWAGNGQGQAAEQFVLVLKGTSDSYAVPLTTGVERADVAKAWNSEGMAKSGYNVSASLAGVTADTYALYAADPANSAADCDLHRTLTVQ